MNEFEFTAGSLEAQGLQEGDEVECTLSTKPWFDVSCLCRVVKGGTGKLVIKGNDGDYYSCAEGVYLKPVSVNVQQKPQGQKLQDILPTCEEGDVLECVCTGVGEIVAQGKSYRVLRDCYEDLFIVSRAGNIYFTDKSRFIKSDIHYNCSVD